MEDNIIKDAMERLAGRISSQAYNWVRTPGSLNEMVLIELADVQAVLEAAQDNAWRHYVGCAYASRLPDRKCNCGLSVFRAALAKLLEVR